MLIELNDLSFGYAGSSEKSLKDISLTVNEGEFILLTGESGCGKTTLTRILNGLCPQFYNGEVSGSYLIDGRNGFDMSLDEIGTYIGNVFQDPRSQFFASNVTDEIVLAMENRNYAHDLMERRLQEFGEMLGITELFDKDLPRLSSGEKQKVAVAAACVTKAKILVLDEPSANLDTDAAAQLGTLLKTLKKQGVTIIISEHRLEYLSELIDRMVVMKNGRIIGVYSRKEALALSDEEMYRLGLRLFYPHTRPDMLYDTGDNTLRMQQIVCKRNNKTILDNITFQAEKGKITAITGRNGAGKTTLCKIAAGLMRENSGTVSINGERLKRRKRLQRCFFVGQDPDYQLYAPTVIEEVLLNIKKSPENIKRAEQLLEQLDLSAFRGSHPASLSGGQTQRVLLAAAIMWERPVLILDEPTSGLDGRHMREMSVLLRSIAESGTCILVITHDIELIHNCADMIYRFS
ncbi:MAG: ATP-binding cassette domain-containing protein [Oscillospiraceae bacterium]|nr:ATP-binding cassette domain-containing protein [Oscillospiraceae bacterium]